MKKLLLLLSCVCCIIMANAENTIPTDEIWYTSTNGNVVNPSSSSVFGATIQSNTYEDGKGIIKFNGPVKSIGYDAFSGCSGLTSITIPNSVKSIGDYAFGYCSGLTSVNFAENSQLISIGSKAFIYCEGLTSVTIPNSITNIGMGAFYNCHNLEKVDYRGTIGDWLNISFSDAYANPLYYAHKLYINNEEITNVVIPDSITEIKPNAFYGCSGLMSVIIPNSVISIGDKAFSHCKGLTSVTIPNSVTSIGDLTFAYSGLTSVTIPNSVTSIGFWQFANCRSLTSIIIPNSVTSIGSGAFNGCSGLTFVTIPESVTSIGDEAFNHCEGLTSVTIPNSVKSIDRYAFSGCSGLTSVTIPNSVTSIGSNAFKICTASTIYCQATENPSGWADDWNPDNRPVVRGCKAVSLSANDNTFGTVTKGKDGLFLPNESVTISAIPAKHCHLVKWSDGDTENPRTIKVTTDTTLIAVFAIDTFKITAYTENGTVSGAGKFAYGTSASLTATPAEHYHFAKWSDGNTENPRTIAVTSDMAFTAMFAIDTLKVTASAGNGTVFGAGNYIYGTSALLVATPAEHYHFAKWSDGNTENPRTITVTEDIALEAIFEKADDISSNAVSALAIYAHHNTIVVKNADADIFVYDAMGRLIARRDVARNVSTEITMQNAGIYIVKVGNEAKKVMTW